MKKTITLILLLCTILPSAQARKSVTTWQEVDTLIARGHYASAYEKSEQLFKEAEREGDGHGMLHSAFLQHKAEVFFQEDARGRALARYKAIIPLLGGADHAAGCMFVGNIYKEYYNHRSYRIDQQATIENPSTDYTQWGRQTFIDTIAHYYALALQHRELLQQYPVEQYDILIEGDDEGRALRPTLYDVVMHSIIEEPAAIEQSEESVHIMTNDSLYDSASTFAQMTLPASTQPYVRQLRLLQELVRAHEESSTSLRTQLDLLRMEYVTRAYALYDRNAYIKGLQTLADEYGETPDHAAEFLFRLAQHYEHTDTKKAISYCEQVLAIAPESEAGKQCNYLYSKLTEPTINLSMSEWILPEEPTFAHIKYRNTTQLHFKVVSCGMMDSEYDVRKNYPHMRSIRSWMREVECPDKYSTQEILTNIAPLAEGSYGLLVSTGPDFDSAKEYVGIVRFNVSNLALIVARDLEEQAMKGFAVNRKDGRRVTDCKVSLQKVSNHQTTLIEEYPLDEEGRFTIPFLAPNDWGTYYIVASDGKSIAMRHLWSTHRKRESNNARRTALYTDRYTYRPGDVLHFNLIGYDMGEGHQAVLAGEKVSLRLTQFRSDKALVETEGTTDPYGCFYGEMALPEDIKPGRYYLEATLGGERFSHIINIEAFKAPTFTVTLDTPQETVRFGDTVAVRGRATTFTGLPLRNAKVRYQVERGRRHLFFSYIHTHLNPFVASGTVTTDGDGNFAIPFEAEHYGEYNSGDTYIYRVTADITDENGETQTSEKSFVVGYRTRQLSVTVPEVMMPKDGMTYTMKTLNGVPIEDTIRLRITKLEVPQTDRLKSSLNSKMKDAEIPISEKSFLKLHPHIGLHPTFDKSTWREQHVCIDTLLRSTSSSETCYVPDNLKDGAYKVEFLYSDGTMEESITHYVTRISEQSTAVPDLELLFTHQAQEEITKGSYADLLIGTSYADVTIHYIIEQGYRVVAMGELPLSKQLTRFPVHAPSTSSDPITVRFMAVKENIVAEREAVFQVIPQEHLLNVKTNTFRDYLEPGQKEECTLTITDASGKPVDAAVTISVYDAALDKYGANEWSFPTQGIRQMSQQLYENSLSRNHSVHGPSIPYYHRHAPQYYLLPIDAEADEEIFQCVEDGNVRLMYAKGRGVAQSNAMVAVTEEASLDQMEQQEEAATAPGQEDTGNLYLRENLSHTALFLPTLRTDGQGKLAFTLTAPDLLTRWHVQGIAHTKDLKHGRVNFDFVTRKTLMVQPHVPRFLYEGDRCDFTAKVSNSGDEPTEATVRLEIAGKEHSTTVSVEAGGSTAVSFPITAPVGENYLTYRITVENPRYSDGQQATIPVLPRRTLVTETMALYVNGGEAREYTFDASEKSHSATLEHKSLTLDIVSNPIWYAIEALPPLSKEENPTNERLFHRYYAATMGSYLINRYPEVENHSDYYRRDSLAALSAKLLSQLAARQSSDGGWAWMDGFNSDRLTTLLIIKGIGELKSMGCIGVAQDDTLYAMVKRGIRHLDTTYYDSYCHMKHKPKTLDSYALYYLYARSMFPEIPFGETPDTAWRHYKRLLLTDKPTRGTLMQKATKMLTLLRLAEQDKAQEIAEVVMQSALSSDEMGIYWRDNTHSWRWDDDPVATQAMLIEALAQLHLPAGTIARMQQWLLKQKQTTQWSSSIATAQAVHALVASPHHPQAELLWRDKSLVVVNAKRLDSPRIDAPFASARREGASFLAESIEVNVENATLHAAEENPRGTTRYNVTPEGGSRVTALPTIPIVLRRTEGATPSWGTLTWQYYEDAHKVTASGTGLTLKCTYYKVEHREGKEILTALPAPPDTILHHPALSCTVLHCPPSRGTRPEAGWGSQGGRGRRPGGGLKDEAPLHKGDRIRVRLRFTADRAMDYVELRLQRPASLEPVTTRSGYTYSNGLGYYRSVEDTQTVFYLHHLDKGDHLIDCDLWVSQRGDYTCGVSTIRCMYAPTFQATAESIMVRVR